MEFKSWRLFIRFKAENNKIHSFIINNKYFPIKLGQEVLPFREEYTKKYDKYVLN